MRTQLIILILSLCLTSNAFSSSFGKLRVGTARIDITPSHRVPLAGYRARKGRPFDGIHDPVYARAIILDNGYTKIGIVGTDLLIITRALREAVYRGIEEQEKKEGINILDELLLCATHNHSGPGAYFDNFIAEVSAMGKYSEEIFSEIVAKIIRAIMEANGNLRPSGIGFGIGYGANLSKNRRVKGGPVDPEIGVMKLEDSSISYMVNFAAHATVLGSSNMMISGDWPGFLERDLEQNGARVAIFTSGAAGDVSPHYAGPYNDRFQKAVKIGKAISHEVLRIGKAIRTEQMVKMNFLTSKIELPPVDLTPIFGFFSFLFDIPLDFLFFPDTTTLQVIQINKAILMGIPCDLGVKVGLEMKKNLREWGFPYPFIISQANDYIGYVMDEDSYRKGGYEARFSFYGSHMAELLMRYLFRMVREEMELPIPSGGAS